MKFNKIILLIKLQKMKYATFEGGYNFRKNIVGLFIRLNIRIMKS